MIFVRGSKVCESCQVSWKGRESHDCKTLLRLALEDHFSAQVFHSIYFQMTITCTTKVQLSKVHSLYAKYICRIVQWKWRPRNRVKITKKSLLFMPKQSVSIFYNFFNFFNFYCLLKQIKLILFFLYRKFKSKKKILDFWRENSKWFWHTKSWIYPIQISFLRIVRPLAPNWSDISKLCVRTLCLKPKFCPKNRFWQNLPWIFDIYKIQPTLIRRNHVTLKRCILVVFHVKNIDFGLCQKRLTLGLNPQVFV